MCLCHTYFFTEGFWCHIFLNNMKNFQDDAKWLALSNKDQFAYKKATVKI